MEILPSTGEVGSVDLWVKVDEIIYESARFITRNAKHEWRVRNPHERKLLAVEALRSTVVRLEQLLRVPLTLHRDDQSYLMGQMLLWADTMQADAAAAKSRTLFALYVVSALGFNRA